jgi:uncharacterized membrane protein (DUF485 family)
MAGLDHGPAHPVEKEDAKVVARNARLGLALFAVYLLLYGGFVGLTAFNPAWMEQQPWVGVNLAIVYGFGLIIAALVLALIYSWLCRAGAASGKDAT